jgi:hypothetical protein
MTPEEIIKLLNDCHDIQSEADIKKEQAFYKLMEKHGMKTHKVIVCVCPVMDAISDIRKFKNAEYFVKVNQNEK